MKRGEDGELHLPQEHLYYAQVQEELAIINREWCDFVVFRHMSLTSIGRNIIYDHMHCMFSIYIVFDFGFCN